MPGESQQDGWHTAGPSWIGWIQSTEDALRIVKAARTGLIPRVLRRLSSEQQKKIVSGFVFVFDQRESRIDRWTDGISWGPSRIRSPFLLYHEAEGTTISHVSGLHLSEIRKVDKHGNIKPVSSEF